MRRPEIRWIGETPYGMVGDMDTSDYLALAPQYTTTGELLADAAQRRGLEVCVLPRAGAAGLRGRPGGHYYGGPLFAAGVVEELGAALLEPSDGWLAELPDEFTGRSITLATLAEARRLSSPAFVKPPTDKGFPAAVYSDGGRLPALREVPPSTAVLISDVVTWTTEFRLFVLDGEVLTGSRYAVFGRLDPAPLDGHPHRRAALDFAHRLLAEHGGTLPSAVTLDVGLLTAPARGTAEWAVVEANMAWFSNCYAADPARVLEVVLRSAGPRARVAGRDAAFHRGGAPAATRP